MERKRLIRPVTVLKVKGFINKVFEYVLKKETFSLDRLARQCQISGSFGTAMIRNKWILETDVKHQFTVPVEYLEKAEHFLFSDTDAKRLIEQVRLMNDKSKQKDTVTGSHGAEVNTDRIKDLSSDDGLSGIKLKSREGADLGSMLNRALRQSNRVPSLFDESRKEREELIQITSAIAGGVFGDLGLEISSFHKMSDERIRELNERIVFTAKDLHKRLSGSSVSKDESEYQDI